MEEADTLCTRIAILSKGRLKCIGTQQHLKNKYGQGYKAEVNCNVGYQNDADMYFKSVTKGAELISSTHNSLLYKIPKSTVLSEMFENVEREKYKHGIQNWSITQSSLDEVFISIVRSDEIGTGDAPQ